MRHHRPLMDSGPHYTILIEDMLLDMADLLGEVAYHTKDHLTDDAYITRNNIRQAAIQIRARRHSQQPTGGKT
jgi:hypothetical protein